MEITSICPVLMTDDVPATAAFYCRHFGFEPTVETHWYVGLARGTWELAILAAGHATIPGGRGRAAAGTLLALEVEDVDAEYARLVTDGPLEALVPLRSEPFGQRHFVVAAPDGVLVDVITELTPADVLADSYLAGA